MDTRIILASSSPRREKLLASLNLPFISIISGLDETINPSLDPIEVTRFLAWAKANAVAKDLNSGLVIGSDTNIVIDNSILGKPVNIEDARNILSILRNRSHLAISGIAIIEVGTWRTEISTVTTAVKMRNYTDVEIDEYIASGEPMDKAGGYGIQGRGRALVEAVEGCYNNVIGLPLCELTKLLMNFGVSPKLTGPVCKTPSGAICSRLNI